MNDELTTEIFGEHGESLVFEKRPIVDILEDSKTIDATLIANEILEWLVKNVENYVDNETKLYKIYLTIDSEGMSETKRLQDLYRAVPDEEDSGLSGPELREFMEKCSDCRRELDKATEKVFSIIQENREAEEKLFKRLVFFYEKLIPSSEGKKRALQIDIELKTLVEGKDDASDAEKKKIQRQIVDLLKEGENLIKYQELEGKLSVSKFEYEAFNVGVKLNSSVENMKEYTIPEGFVIWLELVCKLKRRPVAMF